MLIDGTEYWPQRSGWKEMAEEHLKAIKNDTLRVCSALCVVEIPFHEGKFYDAQDTVKELSLTELTWPLDEHH